MLAEQVRFARRHWGSAAASSGNSETVHWTLSAPHGDVPFESHYYNCKKTTTRMGGCFFGGAGEIRTHGRLSTVTRFPVVPVMTTSILLHYQCGRAYVAALDYDTILFA